MSWIISSVPVKSVSQCFLLGLLGLAHLSPFLYVLCQHYITCLIVCCMHFSMHRICVLGQVMNYFTWLGSVFSVWTLYRLREALWWVYDACISAFMMKKGLKPRYKSSWGSRLLLFNHFLSFLVQILWIWDLESSNKLSKGIKAFILWYPPLASSTHKIHAHTHIQNQTQALFDRWPSVCMVMDWCLRTDVFLCSIRSIHHLKIRLCLDLAFLSLLFLKFIQTKTNV